MKQALKVVEEIKAYKRAMKKTTSDYGHRQYMEKIRHLINELRYYCSYKKDVDFNELMELINEE
jgi:hypothetical protein